MSAVSVVTVPQELEKHTHATKADYERMYAQSMSDAEGFWAKQAEAFQWHRTWDKVKDTSFHHPVSIRWFEGAKLNITENCLDRHLPARAEQIAYIWEGDDPSESKTISYRQLYEQVCRLGNVLRKRGVKKGDRVTIYMPMIPEAVVAMLACARVGAVHSVVFGGFSPEALRGRIEGCDSHFIITADEGLRGGKTIPLKANVDRATKGLKISHVLVVKRTGGDIGWQEGRDIWYHDEVADASAECAAEVMDAEDPLFILYTSGSTGKPKGVLHTTAGYMVYAAMTHQYSFDYYPPVILSESEGSHKAAGDSSPTVQNDNNGDVFWCTADVGWITGHTYITYGPLLNGAKSVLYEGVPNHPDWSRFWRVVDKHKVT